MTKKPKLLYFVTEDWYFCSHRLALAKKAQLAGYDVSVLTRIKQHGDIIQNAGFNLIGLEIERGGMNPLSEIKTIWQIWQIYRRLQPDIIHHVALKPVLYGNIATLFMPKLKVVNLLAGLGAIFSSDKWQARLLKPLIIRTIKILLSSHNTKTIVQNQEDYDLLVNRAGISTRRLSLIKGSGIDTEHFHYTNLPAVPVRIALVSRLLWDKGIGEYVAAVKLLKQNGLIFEALLVGEPDAENLAAISHEQLSIWQTEGYIQQLGYIKDIKEFWLNTHIAVLPSYREGLPKSLLEAAACGRPIVTTNTSGCKEVVDHGINGFLVPVKNIEELAEALKMLILDSSLQYKMGKKSRQKVEQQFSNEIVLSQTVHLYQELMETPNH
jgi:glycosyltransferase involved in cell wall biosynthesis